MKLYSVDVLSSFVDHTSKLGLYNLTRAMALEMAEHGVRVCGVAPGLIETPMTANLTKNKVQRLKMEERIPMGFVGAPQDVGRIVAFLCSDDARYCTGQMYAVDGGWHLINPRVD